MQGGSRLGRAISRYGYSLSYHERIIITKESEHVMQPQMVDARPEWYMIRTPLWGILHPAGFLCFERIPEVAPDLRIQQGAAN
jgi:hypothetical protein